MKTISFASECAARSTLVLVCKRISHRYTLQRITAFFEQGALNLLKLRFYHSIDDHAPTTGEPSGVSILKDYGQVDYIVGEDSQKDMLHELESQEKGSYLKVYAVNEDYYPHQVDVQMYIEDRE